MRNDERQVDNAFPVQWDDPADAELSWELDDMHHPQALTPLAGDYVCKAIGAGFNYRHNRLGLPLYSRCRIVHGYVYIATRFGVPDNERARVREEAVARRRAQSRIVRSYWTDKVFPTLLATYRWLEGAPIETALPTAIAALWDDAWGRMAHLWGLHFMTNAGAYQAINDLADLYESVVPRARPGDAFALVQGFSTELQRVQHDLYHLAERARALPSVARSILENDPKDILFVVSQLSEGEEFLRAFQAFLEVHGHLGQPFDDLRLPSWKDDPALVLAELQKRLRHHAEDPEMRRRRLMATADELADQVRLRLRERPADLQRFEAALALARDVGSLTEDHNYWLDRMLHAHARRFVLRVGTRLADAGCLATSRDVFYLHTGEIREAFVHHRDFRHLVDERKAALAQQSTIKPPKYLGQQPDPSAPPNRFDIGMQPQPDAQRLKGIGASPGTARGCARIVLVPEDFTSVQRGDVLVCPSSNPSWVPLFGIIAGLITNTGGVTSHAAVVAREFGVPAVVGTGDATRRVRNGQQVEVDGTAGEVRLL